MGGRRARLERASRRSRGRPSGPRAKPVRIDAHRGQLQLTPGARPLHEAPRGHVRGAAPGRLHTAKTSPERFPRRDTLPNNYNHGTFQGPTIRGPLLTSMSHRCFFLRSECSAGCPSRLHAQGFPSKRARWSRSPKSPRSVGWHYLSNAACLIWPHLFYVLFVASKITKLCYVIFITFEENPR